MDQNKINESINVRDLINSNLDIFVPKEDDFKQVAIWYTYGIKESQSSTTNGMLAELLELFARTWTLSFTSQEDKVIMLVKRLIASVVLKTSEFSKHLLAEILKYINKNEVKEILTEVSALAKSFENYRLSYSNMLKKWSSNVVQNNTNSTCANGASQHNPKYWITTKSPEGWRRVIYLDKKKQNGEYSVKIGGAEYTGDHGYDAIPLFDSTQQAIDFVNNIKAGKSSTRRPTSYVSLFNFNIVDITNRKYSQSLYKQNLQDYVLVNTECGDAYINKNASCF